MKYKKLTKEQILISLDRLTRFKNTKEKYLRVFLDILSECLIEPKIKKNSVKNNDYSLIADYASEIFNASLDNYQSNTNYSSKNLSLQNFLKYYENSIFINDDYTQELLNNNINYSLAINLISEECSINLKWLKEMVAMIDSLQKYNNETLEMNFNLISRQVRNDKLLKFPIEKIILVEGITEEILLPMFSKVLGYDFYAMGVQIIAAGGKNQVVKKYYELIEQVKLPIFVLLDKDAEDNILQIKPKLRAFDHIHLVSCGEFEDLLPKALIVKTVNSHFKNFLTISENDLNSDMPTAKILEEIFKTKGLHEFKKAEFAKLVRDNITCDADISAEIRQVIDEIKL